MLCVANMNKASAGKKTLGCDVLRSDFEHSFRKKNLLDAMFRVIESMNIASPGKPVGKGAWMLGVHAPTEKWMDVQCFAAFFFYVLDPMEKTLGCNVVCGCMFMYSGKRNINTYPSRIVMRIQPYM